MLHFVTKVIVFLGFWSLVLGQYSTDFEVVSADKGQVLYSGPGRFMWDNRVGSLLSAFAANVGLDSCEKALRGQESRWVVQAVSRSGDTLKLKLTSTIPRYGVTRQDTTILTDQASQQYQLFREPWANPLFTLTIDTTGLSPGALSYIYYSKKYIPYTSFAIKNMVVLEDDTLFSPADTTYSLPFAGTYPYKTVFIDATIPSGGTSCTMGLGYQVKANGASGWSGPLNIPSDSIFVLYDSLGVTPDQPRGLGVSAILADSVRFAFWGEPGKVGRTILRLVRVLLKH